MKKVILTILFSIVLLNFVSAADTEIKIKTLPFYEVQLAIIKTTSSEVMQTFKATADKYGDVKFTFTSTEPDFYINAFMKLNKETIIAKRFPDTFKVGEPISLTLAPEGAQLVQTPSDSAAINQTNSTTPPEQTEPSAASPTPAIQDPVSESQASSGSDLVTGNVSQILNKELPVSYIYYFIGAVVLVIILFFVLRFLRKSYSNSHFHPATKKEASNVMHLQKQLKDAQHEINVLKNKEKIKEIERRIEEEKKELDKLKHGL